MKIVSIDKNTYLASLGTEHQPQRNSVNAKSAGEGAGFAIGIVNSDLWSILDCS